MAQQQKIEEIFKLFELSSKESGILLELIRIGPTSISTWARLTGIKRSSMYVIMKKLKNQHLIKEFPYRGMKYVKAIETDEIEALIDKKSQEITSAKEVYQTIKEDLVRQISYPTITPRIKFYEGSIQVEDVYNAILKENEFVSIFNPERVKKYMPKYHFLIPQNLKKNKGRARELLINSAEAVEYKEKFNNFRHQIKILPSTVDFSSDTIIAGDKIYMIGYGDSKEAIIATEISNSELAKTQRIIFDMLWEKY